jgi:hypothetical protein
MTINSEPKGASVIINGTNMGMTPLEIELERKQDHEIVLAKDGFILEVMSLKRKISPVVLAYILPGGLLSFGIDAAQGCQFTFGSSNIHIPLSPRAEGNSSLAAYFLKKPLFTNKGKLNQNPSSS